VFKLNANNNIIGLLALPFLNWHLIFLIDGAWLLVIPEAVDFVVELARPRSSAERRIVYDFKRADFEMFRDRLSDIPWTSYLWGDSIEDSWQRFKDLLFAAADECIPKVTLRKRKKKTWLSDETLRMIRRKRRANRVMKRSGRSGDRR